jgi:hypothetical protein
MIDALIDLLGCYDSQGGAGGGGWMVDYIMEHTEKSFMAEHHHQWMAPSYKKRIYSHHRGRLYRQGLVVYPLLFSISSAKSYDRPSRLLRVPRATKKLQCVLDGSFDRVRKKRRCTM